MTRVVKEREGVKKETERERERERIRGRDVNALFV